MALPVAAIVCIVLACWVVVVLAIFALYQFLKHRGSCDCECTACGKEGEESCSCCRSLSESCNCCNPSLNGCLNSCCPKKKVSCLDIVLCQCCAEPGQDSCLVNVFPCCTRDCDCCEDCCTCCTDCDAIVCCCLEIRMVSKSNSDEKYSAEVKYTRKYSDSSENNSNRNISTGKVVNPNRSNPVAKTGANAVRARNNEKSECSIEKNVNMRSNLSTPRTPTTARSVSQLQFIDTNSTGKLEKKQRPTTQIKTSSVKHKTGSRVVDNKLTEKSKQGSVRSLPRPPSSQSELKTSQTKGKTSARKRTSKENIAGELKEIPVKQQSVPLHSQLYESTFSIGAGSVHSGGVDLYSVSPQQYDAISQTVSLDASYLSVPLSPGTILDGAGTHRSSMSGSTQMTNFSFQGIIPQQLNMATPRPLPGPPGR